MKKVLLTACMLAFSLAGTAQSENEKKSAIIENENETVFLSPQKVVVNKGSTTTIKITGENDGAEYTYSVTKNECNDDTKTVYKETDSSWDFDIPFLNSHIDNENWSKQSRGRFIVDPTFGFGVIGTTEAGENVNLPFGNGSFEYLLDNIVGFEYRTTRNSYLGVRFGLSWRNYRMIGSNRFLQDGDNILITDYPAGADINYSRIRTFSMALSFLYTYKFNKYVNMRLGPGVSFNTCGNIKTRYSIDGETFKDKQKGIKLLPVTVDFKAELNFRFIGLYFKYSPCNVLNTEFGPGFKPMSAGLLFSF